MANTFTDRLLSGEILISDGATGTNLQARGLPPGISPETWLFERPEAILNLHEEFVAAGSDVILTCSFGGNRFRQQGTPLADRIEEINRTAATLAREAARNSGRSVLVGGSMGPTGHMVEPYGTLKPEEVTEAFAEQASALAEGGVDLLVLETFFALEELEAAIAGVKSATDLPFVCSFSYDRGTRTMMGIRPAQMASRAAELGASAVGANCGTTLENMEQIVLELASGSFGLPIWAKPNAGQPVGNPPTYRITPEDVGAFAVRLREAGARIIGGCCGTTPDHVRAIARSIKNGVTT